MNATGWEERQQRAVRDLLRQPHAVVGHELLPSLLEGRDRAAQGQRSRARRNSSLAVAPIPPASTKPMPTAVAAASGSRATVSFSGATRPPTRAAPARGRSRGEPAPSCALQPLPFFSASDVSLASSRASSGTRRRRLLDAPHAERGERSREQDEHGCDDQQRSPDGHERGEARRRRRRGRSRAQRRRTARTR